MVTEDIIKALWKGVIEAHKVEVSFSSEWTTALDADMDISYPACLWKPPTSGVVVTPNGYAYDTFGIDMVMVDDTDSDRTADERDQAYERMAAIARQCFYRFRELYILDNRTYQGEVIDLGVETAPVFTAIWDEAGKMTTGVRMVLTLRNNINTPCVDEYFSQS
jgi:hypothetical protein